MGNNSNKFGKNGWKVKVASLVVPIILLLIIGVGGYSIVSNYEPVDDGQDGNITAETPTPEPISIESPTPVSPTIETATPEQTIIETPTPEPTPAESEYIYVIEDCSWSQAYQRCIEMGGHLVHFDTLGEMEKVVTDFTSRGFNSKSKFWIGGARNASSNSYTYQWIHADGSYGDEIPISDSHWMKGEPSYIDPGLDNLVESKMIMYFYDNRWVYNDEPDQILSYMPQYSGTIGYICEIEP